MRPPSFFFSAQEVFHHSQRRPKGISGQEPRPDQSFSGTKEKKNRYFFKFTSTTAIPIGDKIIVNHSHVQTFVVDLNYGICVFHTITHRLFHTSSHGCAMPIRDFNYLNTQNQCMTT
mmetsp:Transcript_4341/g.10377  ORF Transcript_4341/g.10377 Transcript_4341/m.10377 type:complete len:117 (+) Transcript_4341:1986-2336(+)